MDRHIGLIFLPERHVNVRLQALPEYIFLHVSYDPDNFSITGSLGLTTRQQPNVLPKRIAPRPQSLRCQLI